MTMFRNHDQENNNQWNVGALPTTIKTTLFLSQPDFWQFLYWKGEGHVGVFFLEGQLHLGLCVSLLLSNNSIVSVNRLCSLAFVLICSGSPFRMGWLVSLVQGVLTTRNPVSNMRLSR